MRKVKKKKISVIIACYNEETNIMPMYRRLETVFKKLPYSVEYIYIDNDSTDKSRAVLEQLAQKDRKVKALFMSRNFGSPQSSFLAGLIHADCDSAILLQGDIQDPPEIIPKFIEQWEKGYEVIYGIRKKRDGYNFFMRSCYRLFYRIFSGLSYLKIPLEVGDFSLLDKVVKDELIHFKENDYYIRGLRAFVGYKQIGVSYVRERRFRGKSNENFFSNIWWAKTFIINFSLKPLEFISKITFLVMLLTIVLIFINLFGYVFNGNSPRGIPTIVILILFIGGIQLLSLSIIAEYLAKIFLEVKGRPRFIIRKTINVKLHKYAKSD